MTVSNVETKKLFRASIITPEALALETNVSSVQIPAHDGMIGLLTHRAPLLTKLGVGILSMNTPAGPKQFLISGGYAQMKDNVLTILTDEALAQEQITAATVAAENAKLAAIHGTDAATLARRQIAQARIHALETLLGQAR